MIKTRKPIAIGESDFSKIILQGCEFIDKTLWIKEILESKSPVLLITRPRRFGKTLNMSMLHHFLEEEVLLHKTAPLFKGLKIADTEFMKEQGKYQVMYLSFNGAKPTSKEDYLTDIIAIIGKLYESKKYLLEGLRLTTVQKEKFLNIINGQAHISELTRSLKDLSQYIFEYHGQRPWLLLDEYDLPILHAFNHGFYEKLIGFIAPLFMNTFKDNPFLQKSVITGIMQIAKEGLFSSLNNVEIHSVLGNTFKGCFGFTEEEVSKLLKEHNMTKDGPLVKELYNGYVFGGITIYNPWSILCYLKSREPIPHWVNTADNSLIHRMIARSDEEVREKLFKLLKGEVLREEINDSEAINYLGPKYEVNPASLWAILLMAGYLKPVNREHLASELITITSIAIPNTEVKSVLKKMTLYAIGENLDWQKSFIKLILNDEIEKFERKFKKLLRLCTSYHDGAKTPEAFYQGLLIGLFSALEYQYKVISNRESGYGRYDIALIPKKPGLKSILFELKVSKKSDDSSLLEAAQLGLNQIDQKKYKLKKPFIKVGVGFSKKRLKVLVKK